nr:integrase core domain-containing protein [Marinisporobacter balticus]
MDGKGHWADNVIVERFFRTLKYDAIYIYHYGTPKVLSAGINRFMKLYNEEHPYQAHDYQTPYKVYYRFKKVT